MKFITFFFIIAVIFGFVFADDVCTSDGKTIKKGEQYKPSGECRVYTCNGKELEVADVCMPLLKLIYPCPLTEVDVTKPFPDCCARFECEAL